MTKINRRTFLKLLPTVPFYKVAWPALQTAVHAKNQAQSSDQPNILFLVFDTLSAQHISLYGYDRQTTPNIARFAEKSTVFHKHVAGGNFTSAGTSTLMTGVYPWTHRAIHLHGLVKDEFAQKNIFSLMPENYHTVAYTHNLLVMSLLHQFRGDLDEFKPTRDLCLADGQFADRLFFEDYTPAYWAESTTIQGGATPPSALFLSLLDKFARFAETRGFENELAELYPRGVPNLHTLSFLLEDAIDWIENQVVTFPQPFMGYFHMLPPHEPYAARADFVDKFLDDGFQPPEKPKYFGSQDLEQSTLNYERRLYDEYLAFTDAEFGRLIDNLEQQGILDNTYIVLTSDHGELFERGVRGHVTLTLYEGLTHIPLVIHKPGQQSREDVYQRTTAVDILPTLMQITGQPVPDWTEGRVLPTFGADTTEDRFVYSVEAKSNAKFAPLTEATIAMYKDDLKLIRYFGYTDSDEYEMYNLQNDSEELTNLYESEPVLAEELTKALTDKIFAENAPYRKE
ncbi:MAG: sulfatase [Anaerolineales bacterium]|nr:sulfatase [Anaerolineales bacterium]